MKDRKAARLEDENNPTMSKAMVEQVVGAGGKKKDKLSSEKSGETTECIQQLPTLQGRRTKRVT